MRDAARTGHLVHVLRYDAERWQQYRPLVNDCLRMACAYGHTEYVQWLHNTFGLTDQSAANLGLRMACLSGHRTVISWLCDKHLVTRPGLAYGIVTAYAAGYPTLANSLIEKHDVTFEDIECDNNRILLKLCVGGWVRTARWVHSTFGISALNIMAALQLAESESPMMLQWLCVTFRLPRPTGYAAWTRLKHESWYWQADVVTMASHMPRGMICDVLRRM